MNTCIDSFEGIKVEKEWLRNADEAIRVKLVETFHRMRTLCPLCLAENAEYSRLIWTSKSISFCRIHHVDLVTICPACRKKVTASALGFGWDRCLNCMQSLMEGCGPKVYPSNWQHFVADEVGALIALPVLPRKPNSLAAILKFALASTGHKSLAANLRHFGLAEGLFFGRSASSSLITFCHLAYGLGLHVHELLAGDLECILARPRPVKVASVRRRERWNPHKLIRLARSTLRLDRKITLARLAYSLGVSTTTLHTHCPKLCRRLKKRRLVDQQAARERRKKALVRQVRTPV